MPVQNTGYTSAPAKAYPGLLADDGPHDIGSVSVDASVAVPPGVLVMRTANGDYAGDVPPALPVADPDAIVTTKAASAGGAQVLTAGVDANGAIGAGRISPPRKLTVTLNNNANWDATVGSITYLDENGRPVTETLTIPDTGNTTLTTSGFASRWGGATIPQQSGTGATYEIGTSLQATLDGGDVLGVSLREHHTRMVPSESDNELWDDGVEMPVLKHGRVYVRMENAFRAGECPMVRVIAGVGEQRGSFRGQGDSDSGDALPFRRARALNSGSAGEFAVLDVRLT
jgi:hypothetical protein